jgi:triosephosphate isomerase
MLADIGATHVLVGHSERRADHGESSTVIRQKTMAAHDAGLIAVVCVGETELERDLGATLAVVNGQIAVSVPDEATAENTVIAYEPVWAIGTGRTASVDEVAEVHAAIRAGLTARFDDGDKFRILYGGSVKPSNAAELLSVPDVDGALVGGASLKVDDFWKIIESCA